MKLQNPPVTPTSDDDYIAVCITIDGIQVIEYDDGGTEKPGKVIDEKSTPKLTK